MDLDIQVKLLRVLERKEIIRVGNSSPTTIDVRLIAATNKDLRNEVREGRFRGRLVLPYLCNSSPYPSTEKRREDIPLLIDDFVRCFQSKCKNNIAIHRERNRVVDELSLSRVRTRVRKSD